MRRQMKSAEIVGAASKMQRDLSVAPSMLEQLFDHVPETAFFMKDRDGRYVVMNQSLVERCGLQEKRERVGRHVREIFPSELGERYAQQDRRVIRTGRPIVDLLELHWYARRRPGWCLTTKLALRNDAGEIVGLIGISRDLRAPGDKEIIPVSLANTIEHLTTHYHESTSPAVRATNRTL